MLELLPVSPYLLCGAAFALAASLFWFCRVFFNSPSATLANVQLLTKWPDLPQGWWTDSERFQAEKRAIFSQVSLHGSYRGLL